MEKIEYGILIEYCDNCAEKNGYPINKQNRIKDSCKLCGRIGTVNQTQQAIIVNFDGFNGESWKGGGFEVDQLIPFPTSQLKETIHPKLSHKLLTEKLALFFDKNILIVTNPQTGQQIRIRF